MKERKNMSTQTNTAEKSTQKIGARTLALVGMLSAVAVVLMTFDIPLPFAPTFYKIDFRLDVLQWDRLRVWELS